MSDDQAVITSTANELVTHARALHRRKGRRASGQYLIEGSDNVVEALADGIVERVIMRADAVALTDDAPTTRVTDQVMGRLLSTQTLIDHAAIARIVEVDATDTTRLGSCFVLDGVADPGNVGTIIRSADAFGFDSVIIGPNTADPWGPKVVRSAAGSLTHVNIARTDDLPAMLRLFADAGAACVGLAAHGAAAVPPRAERVCIVVGSEAHGLDDDVATACTHLWTIPTSGRAESLNAAAAATVAAYALSPRQPVSAPLNGNAAQ